MSFVNQKKGQRFEKCLCKIYKTSKHSVGEIGQMNQIGNVVAMNFDILIYLSS